MNFFCISCILIDEFHILCTQKNPLDSRRFLAMRSCVDLPDPSDHSTIIRVPGRPSVEKNISFLTREGVSFFIVSIFVFGCCTIVISCIRIWFNILYSSSVVKRITLFWLDVYIILLSIIEFYGTIYINLYVLYWFNKYTYICIFIVRKIHLVWILDSHESCWVIQLQYRIFPSLLDSSMDILILGYW